MLSFKQYLNEEEEPQQKYLPWIAPWVPWSNGSVTLSNLEVKKRAEKYLNPRLHAGDVRPEVHKNQLIFIDHIERDLNSNTALVAYIGQYDPYIEQMLETSRFEIPEIEAVTVHCSGIPRTKVFVDNFLYEPQEDGNSMHDIHKQVNCKNLNFSNPQLIRSHVLGILKMTDLKKLYGSGSSMHKWIIILRKHIGGSIFDAQEELIKNGLKQYARI